MRQNPVKKKLQSGEPVYGTWLSTGELLTARVLARLGFDWLTLDMEHSPIDWSQAAYVFGAVADAGCVPLARVPVGSHDNIKRALDAGAWGVVVPMVDTVEQATVAIAAAKYPPQGNRSLGGSHHALNFNATSSEYFKYANDRILVILQTESPRGIANADAIYSLPGVDAIFVGPVDLRAQMRGSQGEEATDEEFEAALAKVVAMGQKCGVPTGMHVMDPETALRRTKQGMQYIAIGSEIRYMSERAGQVLSVLRPDHATAKTVAY